jgi:hypothetical protein
MLTKTENYFSTKLKIKDAKMNEALQKVGKLVAKERNRTPVPQGSSAGAGRTEK